MRTLLDPLNMPRGLIWVAACVLIVGGILYCTQGTSRGSLEPLLEGRICSEWELEQMDIAFMNAGLSGYKKGDGQMLVPSDKKSDFITAITRSSTLPYALASPDSDTFDVGSLFMSESARKSNLQTEKANQLANTIVTTFNDIALARINYDIQDSGGFDSKKVQSASVVLVSKDRKPLAPSRISMIQSLVCGAYAGMKPENVTVTDTSAEKTYNGSEDPEVRRQRHAEYELEQRLTQLLGGYKGLQIVARLLPQTPDSPDSENSEPKLHRAPSKVPSIERDRPESTTPETTYGMHVSVGVPDSQLHSQWIEQYRTEHPDNSLIIAPTTEQLEKIKTKVTENIREAIRPLVTSRNVETDKAIRVWVFPDSDRTIRYASKSETDSRQSSIVAWARANSTAMIPIGILLVVAIVFSIAATRLRMRTTEIAPAEHRSEPAPNNITKEDQPANPLSKTEETTLRDDLAELVESNPELAAQIVHSWMSDAA